MPLHFVQLVMRNKKYKGQVSSEECDDVYDLRGAIKKKFSSLLGSYYSTQLTLFQPDGKTEIDPDTPISDLKVSRHPMVVTVEELPALTPFSSFKKFERMTFEATCRKYLNAIAIELFFIYDFDKVYRKPTMDDLLAAKIGPKGDTWDYRKCGHAQLTTVPLPSLFSQSEWDILKSLNADIGKRIQDAFLPRTIRQRPYIIIPHSKFVVKEYVNSLKQIAAKANVVIEEDNLMVKDESDL